MTKSTKQLYQHEEHLRSHTVRVTDVRRYADLSELEQKLFKPPAERARSVFAIETNETIFYAQGGGQPFDTGRFDLSGTPCFEIEAVRMAPDYRILHFGTYIGGTKSEVRGGDFIEQHIDGVRRNLNSRAHTAGHLVSLAVLKLASEISDLTVEDGKASHVPDACWVEFKGLIDGKHKDSIQTRSNTLVQSQLPVELYWCKPEELPEKDVLLVPDMPVLTGPDGLVRIVNIVGAGAYPCGGTHVQHSGLVGHISIKSIKRQKGNSKVSYTISAVP